MAIVFKQSTPYPNSNPDAATLCMDFIIQYQLHLYNKYTCPLGTLQGVTFIDVAKNGREACCQYLAWLAYCQYTTEALNHTPIL